jgi:hypothetical protein
VSVTTARGLVRAKLHFLPLLFVASVPGRARGAEPQTAQCTSAYENAQILRQRGKLLAARDQVVVCAREQCPEIAQRDCLRWAEELGHEIPSVVIVVRDETDREIGAQRVLVDGAPRPEFTSGRAFELDPGAHVLRIERPDSPTIEQPFTVYQGERDRVVRITVPSRAVTAHSPTPLPLAPAITPTIREARPEPPSYVATAITAGFSVATFAVSAYLGLSGRQELSNLHSTCAPYCTDAEVDPVKTRLNFSDATLGVGLVGAAVTVYLFARTAILRASMPVAHLAIAQMPGGGAAALIGGHF